MDNNQSNNWNYQAGNYTPNPFTNAPYYSDYQHQVDTSRAYTPLQDPGTAAYSTFAPNSNGWTSMNQYQAPSMQSGKIQAQYQQHNNNYRQWPPTMGHFPQGQSQQCSYLNEQTISSGYPTQGNFQGQYAPHASTAFNAPQGFQGQNSPDHEARNRSVYGTGSLRNLLYQNPSPRLNWSKPMANHYYSQGAVVAQPAPTSHTGLAQNMDGFGQMQNPLYMQGSIPESRAQIQAHPSTPSSHHQLPPYRHGRVSFQIPHSIQSSRAGVEAGNTKYQYQHHTSTRSGQETPLFPTPTSERRSSSISEDLIGEERRSEPDHGDRVYHGQQLESREGRERGHGERERDGQNRRGRGGRDRRGSRGGRSGHKRGPALPRQDLPLKARDLVPGAIVWLHTPEGEHEPVVCVQDHDCVDPEKEKAGHNHPVLVLGLTQRAGSDKIGDLLVFVAIMTTLHGLELHDYIEQIRHNGPDVSRNWYFALTMPLEHESGTPDDATRMEFAQRGNNFLHLSRGGMQRQSYVRVNHIYSVPLAQLQSCNKFNKPAYSVRLSKDSYNIVMNKLGMPPEDWEDNVERGVASAPRRLARLRDEEMARSSGSQSPLPQYHSDEVAEKEHLVPDRQGSAGPLSSAGERA